MHEGTLEAGAVFGDRYRITSVIGRGAMSVVYEALDERTRRVRAVKILPRTFLASEQVRRRFSREATIPARISSEHVVEVLDAGVTNGGIPFIVMERLSGKDLQTFIDAQGPCDAEETATYLAQLALVLEKAHDAGIVHRDLKPANVFLTHAETGEPVLKVLDFGVAKITTPETTRHTQDIVGSPHFMAPEQIRFQHVAIDGRADIYALGQLGYCLLVGEPYWRPEDEACDNLMQLLMEIAFGAREPATRRARQRRRIELPSAFDVWFHKATAVRADDRFASASAAALAFAAALQIELPIRLASHLRALSIRGRHPVGSVEVDRKSHRSVGMAVAVAAVVLAAGIAGEFEVSRNTHARLWLGDHHVLLPSRDEAVPREPIVPPLGTLSEVPKPSVKSPTTKSTKPLRNASTRPVTSATNSLPESATSADPNGWMPPVLER